MDFNPFSIIVTLLVLTLIVTIHELGHFLTAKFFKMDIKEFSIGFGKVLLQKHYKGTNYSIRLIPLGGFVELEGEQSTEGANSFRNHPYYQKVIVLAAGVVMNIALAIVLLGGYLALTGYNFPITKLAEHSFVNTNSQEVYLPITVSSLQDDSPLTNILFPGDVIVKINDKTFKSYDEFFAELELSQEENASLTLIDLKDFETRKIEFNVPVKNADGSILKVLLNPAGQEAYFIKYKANVLSGFAMTYDVFVYQIKALSNIIQTSTSTGNYTELTNSVGGIVQVAGTINSVVNISEYSFLIVLIAFISISLAFFNILPIPALDGGHILIITIERITGKKLSDKWLNIITTSGFVLLIALSILVTFKDLLQLGNII